MSESDLIVDTFYLRHNRDVAASGMSADAHYETYGWHESWRDPNALFDTSWYLAHNPDVAAAHVDPLWHYDTYGWKEGRDPSAKFDTSDYLARNPDVAAAGMDPLTHYLLYGQAEGRQIDPSGTVFGSTITGTAGNDSLTGMPTDDRMFGLYGNDMIEGGGGNDELHGGKGNDALYGGDGNNVLYGGAGDDVLYGNDIIGTCLVYGGDGSDFMFSSQGTDVMYGGAGADVFFFQPERESGVDGLPVSIGNDVIGDFAQGDIIAIDYIYGGENFIGLDFLDTNHNGHTDTGDAAISEEMVTLAGKTALSTVIDLAHVNGLGLPEGDDTLTLWNITGLTVGDFRTGGNDE